MRCQPSLRLTRLRTAQRFPLSRGSAIIVLLELRCMLNCRQTLRTSELSSDGVLSNDELQAVIAISRGLRLPLYASISEPAGASIAGGTSACRVGCYRRRRGMIRCPRRWLLSSSVK